LSTVIQTSIGPIVY